MTDYKWLDCVRYKEVLVFGKQVRVDVDIKWVAVDSCGKVIGYWEKPWLGGECTPWWLCSYEDGHYFGKIEMKPEYDWKTMIVEV